MKSGLNGFTLIELMITVAIIGILAAIAIPSYQENIRKSRRVDAEGVLLSLANAMERHFTETSNYCNMGGNGGSNACEDADVTYDTGEPSSFSVPASTRAFYTVTISSVDSSTYTLSALAIGAQIDDKCGVLTLDNVGNRDAKKDDVSVDDCW
jgi:type IV pilus assembly protein PilE